ncbi:hypothetical protein XcyCFBP4188_05410 [Xanthomonas hortorum pv. cynarae]|nr:hypothetical protein XcyCFBP4188_05410 [Xanthomonas hortorum pv. cynarae]
MTSRLARGAASGVGTRRESVRGGSVAASMPPHGPAPGYDAALPLIAAADRQAMSSAGRNVCGFAMMPERCFWRRSDGAEQDPALRQRTPLSKMRSVAQRPLFLQQPTTMGGACTRAGVGPYAAWMPRKSLHGRTCGVSHAGTRASACSRPKPSHKTGRRRARR